MKKSIVGSLFTSMLLCLSAVSQAKENITIIYAYNIADSVAGITTVPALTTNVRTDPPTRTSSPAATNATRATGLAVRAPRIEVTTVRTSPLSMSVSGASMIKATRNAPPTMGTASRSFRQDSATNCAMTSGQFAAATSAPRFSAVFNPGFGIGNAPF